jgi:ATP-dependent Clp protease ATP-binding subunit ClpC
VTNLAKHEIKIKIYKTAKNFLAVKGYSSKYGVRSLKRKIQKYLEDPISEMFLKKTIKNGTTISVKYRKNKIKIDTISPKVTDKMKPTTF